MRSRRAETAGLRSDTPQHEGAEGQRHKVAGKSKRRKAFTTWNTGKSRSMNSPVVKGVFCSLPESPSVPLQRRGRFKEEPLHFTPPLFEKGGQGGILKDESEKHSPRESRGKQQ